MQQENDMTMTHGRDLYRMVGYDVVDRNGERIGTVEDIWEDASKQPAFLAIKTGWLGLGRTHIVPAQSGEVNETRHEIRLPYDKETLKNAPHFESISEFDPDTERQIFDYYGGYGFTSYRENERDWSGAGHASSESTPGDAHAGEESSLQLKKEDLKVGKREVESGGVRLRKVVRSESVNQPIDLKHEEIEIERVPAGSGKPTDATFHDQDIYIPLRREEAVVSKEAKVSETVRARKRTETETGEISETLRKEELEIDSDDEGRGELKSGY